LREAKLKTRKEIEAEIKALRAVPESDIDYGEAEACAAELEWVLAD
jgi:hypothetical protein